MGHKLVPVGDVVVTLWEGEVTPEEAAEFVKEVQGAYQRANRRLVGMSVLSDKTKMPNGKVREIMTEGQKQLSEWQRSIHFVVTAKGFVASRFMMLITSMFTLGSRGQVRQHRTVKEALTSALEDGPILYPMQDVLDRLKMHGIPIE